MNLIWLLTSFEGRINRKPYWIGSLLILFALLALAMSFLKFLGLEAFSGPYGGDSILSLLLGSATVFASVPVMVKRLHDRNKSGHYLWPLVVLESLWAVGALTHITADTEAPNVLGWCVIGIYFAIALWLFVELGFCRGTNGDNAYGPDPLAKSGTAAEPVPSA